MSSENARTTLELTVPSELGNERFPMAFAGDVAREIGFSEDRIENLKIAVAEACMNAIEHGNKLKKEMKVKIDYTFDALQLEICVQDKGGGFAPKSVGQTSVRTRMERNQSTKRGWGISMINKLADKMEYLDVQGETHLRMVFKVPK